MEAEGMKPDGIEIGNAWALRQSGAPTNWIIGQSPSTPEDSLRFMAQSQGDVEGRKVVDLCVKWFVHEPDHPEAWGGAKPTSDGRTCSILAGTGKFELKFSKDDGHYKVTLDKPGDFAIWGPGFQHSWRSLEASTIMTCRWKPL